MIEKGTVVFIYQNENPSVDYQQIDKIPETVCHVAFPNALFIFILLIMESQIYEVYHVANLEGDIHQ